MYQVSANGTILFSSRDVELVKRVFRSYEQFYCWASVQVKKVSK